LVVSRQGDHKGRPYSGLFSNPYSESLLKPFDRPCGISGPGLFINDPYALGPGYDHAVDYAYEQAVLHHAG